MNWSTLPTELQLTIAGHLDHSTLKSLRQTDSRYGKSIATPFLFRTVHISPNASTIMRARRVAATPHLMQHVTRLVYHVAVVDEVYVADFPAYREYILDQVPASEAEAEAESGIKAPTISEKDALEMYDTYMGEVEAQRQFQNTDELGVLKALVDSFEQLKCVEVKLDYYDSCTGLPSSIDEQPHCLSMLKAVKDTPLRELSLGDLNWSVFEDLEYSSSGVPQGALFNNLQKLLLALVNSDSLELGWHRAKAPFKDFLTASQDTLTHLTIDFDLLPYDDAYEGHVPISEAVFELHWPKLEFLDMRCFVSREDVLIRFLERHRPTLRKLHLGHVEVQARGYPRDQDKLDSVISLLWRIGSCCDLREASLSGTLTNRYTEEWYVGVSQMKENCLRAQFERFLSHNGPWPFPPMHTYRELMQRRYQSSLLQPDVNRKPVLEQCADDSMAWCLDLFPKDFV